MAKARGNYRRNHEQIQANALVLCDIPEGATAVGVPARIIIKDNNNLN
jgi:serine O-acetyltransferase